MRLTLLIPELLWSEAGDREANAASDASQLAKFLARRRPDHSPARRPWEASLLDALGLPANASLAALRARGETLTLGDTEHCAHWLCADPVHMRFHQNRLILADSSELDLQAEEMTALATTINAHLAPVELRFSSGEQAYLRLNAPASGQLVALSQKVGCEIHLEDLAGDAHVRQVSNELQMLLHDHPVNQVREAAGRPTINAFWLWGAGVPVQINASPTRRLFSHGSPTALLSGIAATLNAPHLAWPETPFRPHEGHDATDTLVFSNALLRPAHYQNSTAYAQAWAQLDRELLHPALNLLRRGQISTLHVIAPTVLGELRWSLTPWAARRTMLNPMTGPRLSALESTLESTLARTPAATHRDRLP